MLQPVESTVTGGDAKEKFTAGAAVICTGLENHHEKNTKDVGKWLQLEEKIAESSKYN
jgi:hypothetical protein